MIENIQNPLEVAKKLGESIGGDLGKLAFGELELAFANSLLPRFADNQYLRMRAHILFYWDASYLKSTLLDTFFKCIPDSIQTLDVTTNSPEVLFGSITDEKTNPRIILPAFTDVSIAKINELATFVSGT